MLNRQYWQNYRLGDIIKGWTLKKWPTSIGSKYISRTSSKKVKKKKNNFRILRDIIKQKIKKENFPTPGENKIILHLRLGDVIRSYDKKTKKFTVKDNFEYVTKLDKLEKCLQKLDSQKKILIVYGTHKKNIQIEANKIYLQSIKNVLRSNNFTFQERFSGNPDEDFVFMCKASTFIKSGGGFSKLIADMVERNNGTVIDPIS
jgi:hypothetical protein